jgi:hypothetical protein
MEAELLWELGGGSREEVERRAAAKSESAALISEDQKTGFCHN